MIVFFCSSSFFLLIQALLLSEMVARVIVQYIRERMRLRSTGVSHWFSFGVWISLNEFVDCFAHSRRSFSVSRRRSSQCDLWELGQINKVSFFPPSTLMIFSLKIILQFVEQENSLGCVQKVLFASGAVDFARNCARISHVFEVIDLAAPQSVCSNRRSRVVAFKIASMNFSFMNGMVPLQIVFSRVRDILGLVLKPSIQANHLSFVFKSMFFFCFLTVYSIIQSQLGNVAVFVRMCSKSSPFKMQDFLALGDRVKHMNLVSYAQERCRLIFLFFSIWFVLLNLSLSFD